MSSNRLPSGETTESDEEYVEAWREFAQPICEAADLVMYAFDPDILCHTRGQYPKVIDLPTWFVQRINAALEHRDA